MLRVWVYKSFYERCCDYFYFNDVYRGIRDDREAIAVFVIVSIVVIVIMTFVIYVIVNIVISVNDPCSACDYGDL